MSASVEHQSAADDAATLIEPETYPTRWVGYCTCSGSGSLHELFCGWEIDDQRPRRTRVAS